MEQPTGLFNLKFWDQTLFKVKTKTTAASILPALSCNKREILYSRHVCL